MKRVLYPCCPQPTGEPIHNGYVHPAWRVPRHICFNGFWECPECGDWRPVDLYNESDRPEFECDCTT